MTLETTVRAPARLRSSSIVREVIQSGRHRAHGTVVVHVATMPITGHDDAQVRFTAVASRRVGIAVVRNRAKRLVREAVRAIAWRPGTTMVVVARRSIVGSTLEQVTADLRIAATALGVTA